MKYFQYPLFLCLVLCLDGFGGPIYAQDQQHSLLDVQKALTEQGFKLGTPDGNWGKRSMAALKNFQKAHGLPVTGRFDDASSTVLFPQAKPEPPPSPTVVPPPTPPAVPVNVQPNATAASSAVATPPVPATVTSQEPAPVTSSASFSGGTTVSTPPQPSGSSGGSGAAIFWLIVAAAVGLFIWRRRSRKKALQSGEAKASTSVPATLASTRSSPPNIVTSTTPSHDGIKITLSVDGYSERPVQSRNVFGAAKKQLALTQAVWISPGTTIQVAGVSISGGMIYVGEELRQQETHYENENCLIDPSLSVANIGDPQSAETGYWPSYSRITPGARKAYLTWLASTRDNPTTNIGFVFLYFYGLERRLILEQNAPDASLIAAEVRRLLSVYGENYSFRRYADALLSAYELMTMNAETDLPTSQGNGYEIPLSIKVALGRRVQKGLPIEPELLLMFVMSHPETKVRTPAKRAYTELKELFAEKVEAAYPDGLRVSQRRAKKITATYRACSNSFQVDITPSGEGLPDVTGHKEPVTTGQTIFDECMEALSAYSREIGRTEGLKATIGAISKLPPSLRQSRAAILTDRPLEKLAHFAGGTSPVKVIDVCLVVGIDTSNLNRTKLKELSSVLGAFGFGHSADPSFGARAAKADDVIRVFASAVEVGGAMPSEDYAHTRMSMMLSLAIAFADGKIHELERRKISEMIGRSPITADERLRLEIELDTEATNPSKLTDWYKRVKEAPASSHSKIADELIAVAVADGTVDAREVAHLEKLFRQMGLDTQLLYTGLQAGFTGSGDFRDGDLPVVVPAGDQRGVVIPAAPVQPQAFRFDAARLEAIRRDTKFTASVLSDIFDETPEEEPIEVVRERIEEASSDHFDGLERRYVSFLIELQASAEWTAADFDQLARNADLFPGAAREALNDWSLDRFDELLLEGDDPIEFNAHILPPGFGQSMTNASVESELA